jgi:hypothetical protein
MKFKFLKTCSWKNVYNMRYDFKIHETQIIITKLAYDKKRQSHAPQI